MTTITTPTPAQPGRVQIISALFRKDLISALRNPNILFPLIMPLVIAVFFRIIFPQLFLGTNRAETLNIVIYNPSQSTFATTLEESGYFNIEPAGSAESAEAAVSADDGVIGGIVIPAGFDTQLANNQTPQFTVYINDREGQQYETNQLQIHLTEALHTHANQPLPAQITYNDLNETPLFNEQIFFSSLFLTMAITFAGAMPLSQIICEEKERKALDHLLTSPAGINDIMYSKLLLGFTLVTLIIGGLLLIAPIHSANWPLTLLASFITTLFCIGIGYLLGNITPNKSQVQAYIGGILMTLLVPTWVLAANSLPTAIEIAMHFIPTHYYLETLARTLTNTTTLTQELPNLAILTAATTLIYYLIHRTNKQQLAASH